MNAAELKRFRAQITARLTEIGEENALGQDGQAVVELDQQAVGRLSRMDALQMQAMAQAQQGRRDLEARRLEAALTRIDEGEYGYCAECGEDIPRGRLELDLAALTCVGCASG
ncbi:MAG: TraR/DksA family transcriptional regulator [Paracoccaceae bacterium]